MLPKKQRIKIEGWRKVHHLEKKVSNSTPMKATACSKFTKSSFTHSLTPKCGFWRTSEGLTRLDDNGMYHSEFVLAVVSPSATRYQN